MRTITRRELIATKNRTTNTVRYGLLEVREGTEYSMFSYRGNMGARVEVEVRDAIARIYNGTAADHVLKNALMYDDGVNVHSDPSYSWVAIVLRTAE